jgi:hypothetical protein
MSLHVAAIFTASGMCTLEVTHLDLTRRVSWMNLATGVVATVPFQKSQPQPFQKSLPRTITTKIQ